MTETQAKKQLMKMLSDFTFGSVLHLLAGISREIAEDADQESDSEKYERAKSVERTLFVVGVGIDAMMVG